MNVGRPMMLDAHPIAPPPNVDSPSGKRDATREWRTSNVQAGLARTNVETPILQTEGEWDGCDVYVLPSIESVKNWGPGTGLRMDGFYRFKVFAVVEGIGASLLASGFVCPGHLMSGNNRPILAVQARGPRCKYEVHAAYVATTSPAPLNWPVKFSLVAGNDLASPDPEVGVSRSSYSVISTVEQALPNGVEALAATATSDPSEWEVVKVIATNTNAAARALQLFDLGPFGGPAPGAVPALEFQLLPGETREFNGPFGMRFGQNGLHAGVSSTAGTYTAAAAGDIVYQVVLR